MNSEMNVTATNATTGGSAKGSLSTSAIRFTAGIDNHWTMDCSLVAKYSFLSNEY